MPEEPYRILHIIKSLGLGGAERLLVDGLAHAGEGFDYSYAYFLPHKDHLVPELERAGARVHLLGGSRSLSLPFRLPTLVRLLRRRRIDLVHAHLPVSGLVARVAGRLAGVPVVYTEHNLVERYHPLTRRLHPRFWRWQRAVVAVSGEVAESVRRMSTAVPVRVVHNGVPIDRLRLDPGAARRVRRELGIPPGAPVVGTVAVFRPQKRLDLWFRAATEIHRRRPGTHFVLVGDGPERQLAAEHCRHHGLDEVTHFPGLLEDVRPFVSAFDLFLVSSDYEGLPLAVLEAMCLECPVVATAVGGIPEVITPGRDGVLVPAGDADGLAAETEGLLAAPERRRRLGEAARRRVEEDFSQQRMVEELERLYTSVLEAG